MSMQKRVCYTYAPIYCGILWILTDGRSSKFPPWRHQLRSNAARRAAWNDGGQRQRRSPARVSAVTGNAVGTTSIGDWEQFNCIIFKRRPKYWAGMCTVVCCSSVTCPYWSAAASMIRRRRLLTDVLGSLETIAAGKDEAADRTSFCSRRCRNLRLIRLRRRWRHISPVTSPVTSPHSPVTTETPVAASVVRSLTLLSAAPIVVPEYLHDTIRDAILTCARKPTWVGLIYRTVSLLKIQKISHGVPAILSLVALWISDIRQKIMSERREAVWQPA